VDQRRDAGVVTPVEMMYLLVFVVVATACITFLGRLHAASVEVNGVAQAAARAASMESTSRAGTAAAQRTVAASALAARCASAPTAEIAWTPSPTGTWHGGAVRVQVRCTVTNTSLAGGLLPGARTISGADSQPIDRYQR
jgi:Flp pilus assembly protein TadG